MRHFASLVWELSALHAYRGNIMEPAFLFWIGGRFGGVVLGQQLEPPKELQLLDGKQPAPNPYLATLPRTRRNQTFMRLFSASAGKQPLKFFSAVPGENFSPQHWLSQNEKNCPFFHFEAAKQGLSRKNLSQNGQYPLFFHFEAKKSDLHFCFQIRSERFI